MLRPRLKLRGGQAVALSWQSPIQQPSQTCPSPWCCVASLATHGGGGRAHPEGPRTRVLNRKCDGALEPRDWVAKPPTPPHNCTVRLPQLYSVIYGYIGLNWKAAMEQRAQAGCGCCKTPRDAIRTLSALPQSSQRASGQDGPGGSRHERDAPYDGFLGEIDPNRIEPVSSTGISKTGIYRLSSIGSQKMCGPV